MSQENNKIGYSLLLTLILGAVCTFLIAITMISRGFGIPVVSWPWLIGCHVGNLFIQGFLYNSTKALTR